MYKKLIIYLKKSKMIDSHKTLSEKFLKKWFWLYFFSFVIAPTWYIIKILISQDISVEEVWVLYGIISLVTLLATYNDLWMSESLKYFLPKFIEKKEYDKVKSVIFYAFFVQFITSLFIAVGFYLWADFLWTYYFKSESAVEVLKIFAFFFIWINIFRTINTFFLAVQNTFLNKLTEFIRMLFIMSAVIFIFIWWYGELLNYSYAWLIWLYAWLIITLIVFYLRYYKTYLKQAVFTIDTKLIKEVFSYASFVLIWIWAWTILWQIDMQMVIYLLWSHDAGYYTNYLSIVMIPNLLIWPIFAFLFPVFSQLYWKKDIQKIKLIKQIFNKIFILIAIMFSLFFFVFASFIAYTLFGDKFITSWEILRYSVLFVLFHFLVQINFQLLAGIWKIKERIKILLMVVFFNIIMNILLIQTIWVYGAALATWLGWLLMFLLSEYFLWKKYMIKYDIASIFKNLSILSIIAIWFYYYWLDYIDWFTRWKTFFILLGLWCIWFIWFVIINLKEFKIFIQEVKKLKR